MVCFHYIIGYYSVQRFSVLFWEQVVQCLCWRSGGGVCGIVPPDAGDLAACRAAVVGRVVGKVGTVNAWERLRTLENERR
jgi:hypothetical protein